MDSISVSLSKKFSASCEGALLRINWSTLGLSRLWLLIVNFTNSVEPRVVHGLFKSVSL